MSTKVWMTGEVALRTGGSVADAIGAHIAARVEREDMLENEALADACTCVVATVATVAVLMSLPRETLEQRIRQAIDEVFESFVDGSLPCAPPNSTAKRRSPRPRAAPYSAKSSQT